MPSARDATVPSSPLPRLFSPHRRHHIADITQLFGKFKEATRDGQSACGPVCRAEHGAVRHAQAGTPVPDASLRDTENAPLSEDVETYFKLEVLPRAPHDGVDRDSDEDRLRNHLQPPRLRLPLPRPPRRDDAGRKACTRKIPTVIGGLSK